MSPRSSFVNNQDFNRNQSDYNLADNLTFDHLLGSFYQTNSQDEDNDTYLERHISVHNLQYQEKMKIDWVSSAYALVIASGGLVGYFKAGSVPSLVAGLVFGGILGVGAYLTSMNPSHYHLTLGTSAVLTCLMGYRYYASGKFMPAGLVTLLSLAMVVNMSYQAIVTSKSDSTHNA